jgi:FHS family L-fucose permease-like MFS transporter
VLAILLQSIKIEGKTAKIEASTSAATVENFSFDALKFPQLKLGMIAIFVYVGVEVTVQSNLGALLATSEYGAIPNNLIFPFISLYWGSLMIGRWTGASESLSQNSRTRKVLQSLLPFVAFSVVYAVNFFKAQAVNFDIDSVFLPYLIFVVGMVAVSYFSIENSAKMLFAFGVTAVLCMIGGMLTSGNVSLLFFMSGGLWCSVMWPCIFANAIKNLGTYTSQGSAFLIMMILGGAIIPPLQGLLADNIGIKQSYIVAPICFAYLVYYGWWSWKNTSTSSATTGEEAKVAH